MKDIVSQLDILVGNLLKTDGSAIDWEHKPSPVIWSKKEILGHLIDSAQVNLQRFVRCTYQEGFKLVYEQDEWVKAAAYQQASVTELLILWESLNRQIGRVLSVYPVYRLQAKCDTGRYAENLHTVDWLAADYIAHLQHHLNQIYQP
jgi:hypothetical protein